MRRRKSRQIILLTRLGLPTLPITPLPTQKCHNVPTSRTHDCLLANVFGVHCTSYLLHCYSPMLTLLSMSVETMRGSSFSPTDARIVLASQRRTISFICFSTCGAIVLFPFSARANRALNGVELAWWEVARIFVVIRLDSIDTNSSDACWRI